MKPRSYDEKFRFTCADVNELKSQETENEKGLNQEQGQMQKYGQFTLFKSVMVVGNLFEPINRNDQ